MVLFVTNEREGKLKRSAAELVAAARTLGGQAQGLVLGAAPQAAAEELARYGADVTALAGRFDTAEDVARAVADRAAAAGAEVVLFSADRLGLSAAPRVAVRLNGALLEDVTDVSREGGSV